MKKWFVLMNLIVIVIASGCAAASPKIERAQMPVVEQVVVEREEAAYAPAPGEGS